MGVLSACLLLLALTYTATEGFQYFVQRQNGAGVCVSDAREYCRRDIWHIPPSSSLPPAAGDVERRWSHAWRSKNVLTFKDFSDDLLLDFKEIATDGTGAFKKVVHPYYSFYASAVEATFLLVEKEAWRLGAFFRVRVDQVDPVTELKHATAAFCRSPHDCLELQLAHDATHGTSVFAEELHWTKLRFSNTNDALTLLRDDLELLQWNCSDIRKRAASFWLKFIFVSTQQRHGLFRVPIYTMVKPSAEEESNVQLSGDVAGGACVQVQWATRRDDRDCGAFEARSAAGGALLQHGRLRSGPDGRTLLRLSKGPGLLRLELRNLTQPITHIGPCTGEMEIFGLAAGCSVFEQSGPGAPTSTTTLQAAQLNGSLSVELSQEQMRRVCTALGFEERDVTENVKFCCKWGCAFRRCYPHN